MVICTVVLSANFSSDTSVNTTTLSKNVSSCNVQDHFKTVLTTCGNLAISCKNYDSMGYVALILAKLSLPFAFQQIKFSMLMLSKVNSRFLR